jgi:hypothetical protein
VQTTKDLQSAESIGARKAGFAAGMGILAMIYPAIVVLTMLEDVLVKGSSVQTEQNVVAAGGLGSRVWIMLGIVVALDVVVSLELRKHFAPVAHGLARTIMVSRLAYTAIFAIAIFHLTEAAGYPNQSLTAITRFNNIWHASLLVFGIHLLLIGWILVQVALTSNHLYKVTGFVVGGLLLVSGAGYLIDNVGLLFFPGYATSGLMIAALATGETLFAVWLLLKSLRFVGIPTLVRKLQNGSK